MADVIQLPGATREPVIQQRRSGRLPRQVASLAAIRRAREDAVARHEEASKRETIEALQWMLQEARRGALLHMIAIFEHDGEQPMVCTGLFKAEPSHALDALDAVATFIGDEAGG